LAGPDRAGRPRTDFLGMTVGTSFSSTFLFVGCLALAVDAL
jgi:hypothetical protein